MTYAIVPIALLCFYGFLYCLMSLSKASDADMQRAYRERFKR